MRHLLGIIMVCGSAAIPCCGQTTSSTPATYETFCDSLMVLLLNFFPDSVESPRVTVFPFHQEGTRDNAAYGIWVGEYFVQLLREHPRFELVERKDFRKTLRAQDLSPKDGIDDSSAVTAARKLDCTYFLHGSITRDRSAYLVNARFVDARTGIITSGATVETGASEIDKLGVILLERETLGRLKPAVIRSLILPGYGQLYRKRIVPGVISMTATLGAAAASTYFTLGPFADSKTEYNAFKEFINDPHLVDDTIQWIRDRGLDNGRSDKQIQTDIENEIGKPLEKDYKEKRFIVSAGYTLSAALWALNIVDVVIAGRSLHTRYRLYFSALPPGTSLRGGICLEF